MPFSPFQQLTQSPPRYGCPLGKIHQFANGIHGKALTIRQSLLASKVSSTRKQLAVS